MAFTSCRLSLLSVLLCLWIGSSLVLALGDKPFTQQEVQALKKFHPLVDNLVAHEYQKDDSYLMKFLRAKQFNVKDAKDMLVEALKWRISNGIDNILNETIPLAKTYQNYTVLVGRDKDGHPVYLAKYGGLDMRKILLNGKKEELNRFRLQWTEKTLADMRQYSKQTGTTTSQFNVILDLQGFNARTNYCLLCRTTFIEWALEDAKYYPGNHKRNIWINAPRSALSLFNLAKPILIANSRTPPIIFESNREEWQRFLKNIIRQDQLALEYGGTNTGLI